MHVYMHIYIYTCMKHGCVQTRASTVGLCSVMMINVLQVVYVCILYLLYDTFMHVCMCLLIFQHVFPVYEHKYFYSTHLCLL